MSNITAKRVSNYELFYDLVFVLATSGLTGLLHNEHFTLQSLIIFISASVGILSIWFYETVYLNKFGERDRIDVYTIITSMFVIGQMSVNMTSRPTQATLTLFQFLYALAYGIILLQYYLRGKKGGFNSDFLFHVKNLVAIVIFYLLTTVGAATNLLKIGNWAMFVTFVPLLIPFFLRNVDMTKSINFPHLLERCQLITIITFGETVIAIIRSYPFISYPLESILLFVGMAFLFVRYITQTHLNIDHHQVARTQPLIYTHLFLVMGLNLFTVGIEMLVNQHHANLGFIFFIVGILIYYTSILLTTRYNKPLFRYDKEEINRYLLLLAAGICLLWLSKFSLLLLSVVFAVFTWNMMWLGAVFRRRAQQKQEKS